MPNSIITWNNVSSDALNVKVERFPHIIRASRKYEQVSVPGRNGNLYFYQDAFNNYDQEYEIYAGTGVRGNVASTFDDIASWLVPRETSPAIFDYINLTVGGYHQLIDSYEPNTIRLATYIDSMDTVNAWSRYGQTTLRFNCRPERFTSDAFTAVTLTTSGGYLTNPTDRESKPFIKVYGSGSGTLTVNGYTISIIGMTDYLHIDCDSQNCFRQVAENRNSLITLTRGFPVLKADGTKQSTVSWTGGITSVEITPRWWKL